MTKISEIKKGLETKFNELFIHKAYVQYFFDAKHLESVLKPLERIPLVLRIKNLQESFILRKPAYYLNGKPVFQLIRGFPLSIELSLLQEKSESVIGVLKGIDVEKTIVNIKNTLKYALTDETILQLDEFKKSKKEKDLVNTHILEKRVVERNSSFELDTWLQTSYNKVLLGKRMFDIQILFLWISTIITTMLFTWIIADSYFEGYYRKKFKGTILLFEFMIRIIGGTLCLISLVI